MIVARIGVITLLLSSTLGYAAMLPGNTPEERSINGAKAYMKAHGLQTVTLNVLANPLQSVTIRHISPEFEKATGIKLNVIAIGYTEIPGKS